MAYDIVPGPTLAEKTKSDIWVVEPEKHGVTAMGMIHQHRRMAHWTPFAGHYGQAKSTAKDANFLALMAGLALLAGLAIAIDNTYSR